MLQIVTFFILSWSSGVSQASTGQIQLAWNPVEDSRVARYELHYGSASKSYQSQVQSTTAAVVVAGLESGSTYFFAARACTSDGSLCSAFSNEVVASVPYAPPVAGFSATNLSGVAPLTVIFSDTSSGAISGWTWDFGDGSSSTAASPTHVYGVPGKYNVSLIVTGPGGQDTETRSGYVSVAHPAPIADFNSDVVSGVAPLTVRFSDSSSGAVSGWAWDFGDGNSSSEASPTHTYTIPGTYSVSLVVAGPGGQGTETRSGYIQVGSEPIVDVGEPKLDSELLVPAGVADLTSEGVTDWVHWGLDNATSVNRKSGASPQIGDLLMIGGTPKTFASTSRLNYAWTDGMPKASVTTGAGLYIAGLNNGYEMRVPADTNERNLVVYLGGYKTRGQLEVRLSDDSAPAYTVAVEDLKTAFDRRLALSYRAAKPGQELIVRYTQTLSSGNITMQAATLKGNLVNQAPVLAAIGDRTLQVGEPLTIDVNATDEDPSSLVMAASPLPGTATFEDMGNGSGRFIWTPSASDVSTNAYSITFTATDTGGKGLSTSETIAVTVSSAPIVPELTPSLTTPTGTADLTAEGTADWTHWGIDTASSISRKAGVATQIGPLGTVGGTPLRFNDSGARLAYSWNDGTPNASTTTRAGLYISGLNKGYELKVPADTSARTLTLYLGGFKTRGQLEVRLSDNSAPAYTVAVEDLGTAFDRRVALTYRAASEGQQLIVRYMQVRSGGNITLQAATLKGNLANQAPVLAAIGDRTLEVGESLTIDVNATDEDVSSLVMAASPLPGTSTFKDLGNGIGRLTWTPTASDVSINAYNITFTATDTGGKGLSTSETIAVTVKPAPIVPELTPSLTTPTGTANLTAEGATDWTHWGIDTALSISRKAGVSSQIGTLSTVGGSALRFNDTGGARLAYSWNDGAPTASATTRAGLYISGLNKGYELSVPADTSARTLTLYLGGYKTRGQLEVRLSDNSAPAYTVAVEDLGTAFDRRIALTYRAASAGQQLIVRYIQVRSGGNITLQAATLQSISAETALATAEAPVNANLAGSTQSATATGAETTGPAIEIGEVEINQEWQRIEFQREFNDPIVVVKALSAYDTEPAVVRVDAIDSKGFWIRVQRWDYLDDAHELELVSYLVVERGLHELSDGTLIEAGSLETGVTQAFQRQSFGAPFEEAPVVFAAVTSFNESDAVTARLHNIDSDGFDVGMREQEANAQQHLPERIDYIAWEVSSGVVDGMRYEVGRTGTNVSHNVYNHVYGTTFQRPPVLVADMQTAHEDDTAALRWQNLNVESVDLWVQEEQSRDLEMTHVPEDVGYFVADVE
ncbi:PKD domain-containing protein [Thiocapsa rosea]|uniref:PKD repeat protein n=1 Tax=Thiocapsa rosea TaxID=69360 RepID=A0A495VDI4_9GAMM|nr:PKD domain-containing protein [Thiocapsa rosea]RKT47461.1 PKD repeat protein [Thiocapsa rosea]